MSDSELTAIRVPGYMLRFNLTLLFIYLPLDDISIFALLASVIAEMPSLYKTKGIVNVGANT